MKNLKNKKGFTLVELVIVIAVIAILAAVLIPTFSNVIEKANASKELQEVTNAYKEALVNVLEDGVVDKNETTSAGGYTFTFDDAQNATITKGNEASGWQLSGGVISKATSDPSLEPDATPDQE